jgi:hypothetical protein
VAARRTAKWWTSGSPRGTVPPEVLKAVERRLADGRPAPAAAARFDALVSGMLDARQSGDGDALVNLPRDPAVEVGEPDVEAG